MKDKPLSNLWVTLNDNGSVRSCSPSRNDATSWYDDEPTLYVPAARIRELVEKMQKQTIGYQNALEVLEALCEEGGK